MRTLERWLSDLRLATRSLSRTPGFAAITALTLALAIGANAAIFATVNAVVVRPLPFANVDRLMYVAATAPGSEFPGEFGMPFETWFQIRDRSTRVESFAFFQFFTGTVRIGDRVERLQLSQPTYTLFATLAATPVLGRLPGPDDDMRTALLSYRIWQDWLGATPDVIGKTYIIDGEPREIIGVLGPEFRFPSENVAAWVPVDVRLDRIDLGEPGSGAVARVKAGVAAESLEDELTGLVQQLPDRFGTSSAYARLLPQLHVVARPLRTEIVGRRRARSASSLPRPSSSSSLPAPTSAISSRSAPRAGATNWRFGRPSVRSVVNSCGRSSARSSSSLSPPRFWPSPSRASPYPCF